MNALPLQAARCKRTGSDESWHETRRRDRKDVKRALEYVIDNPEKNDKKNIMQLCKEKNISKE